MFGDLFRKVEAVTFMAKLRGRSQPVLVRANDGFLYVVKFADNPQGENLLFNECMGSAIYRAFGLQGPNWAAVLIQDSFLDANPRLWYRTEGGFRRPRGGWGFGSRFLGQGEAPILEILAGSRLSRVKGRASFLMAWVVDLLCDHSDNREALFLEDESKWLDAYFIDHGHMFGGPRGSDCPIPLVNRYLDPRIYPEVTENDCTVIMKSLESVDYRELSRLVIALPSDWVTVLAAIRFQMFLDRLVGAEFLRDIGDLISKFAIADRRDIGRKSAQLGARINSANLCSKVLWSRFPGLGFRWTSHLAGDEESRRGNSLFA